MKSRFLVKISFVLALCTVIILSFALCIGCSKKSSDFSDIDVVLTVNISSPYSDCYYDFVLAADKTLYARACTESLGESIVESDVSEFTEKELTETESNSILTCLDGLNEKYEEKIAAVFESVYIRLDYKGHETVYYYGNSKNENYDDLITYIIQFSPIDVVDYNGEKILPLDTTAQTNY